MIQITDCFYCKNETLTVGNISNKRYCEDCDVFFHYIRNTIQSLQMSRVLSLNPTRMATIYIFPTISQIDLFVGGDLILSINHLENITPDTAKEWIDRRLKLKAFI